MGRAVVEGLCVHQGAGRVWGVGVWLRCVCGVLFGWEGGGGGGGCGGGGGGGGRGGWLLRGTHGGAPTTLPRAGKHINPLTCDLAALLPHQSPTLPPITP